MTLYDELGISPGATSEEIRAAHRDAVKQHHPDVGGDGDRFDRAQKAYSILSDPQKRERYDTTGEAGDDPAAADSQAIDEILAQALAEIVQGRDNLAQVDVVAKSVAILHGRIDQLTLRRHRATEQLRRLKTARDRLTWKDDAAVGNPLATVILRQVRELEGVAPQTDRMLRLHGEALAILAKCGYRTDPAEQTFVITYGADPGAPPTIHEA